MTAEPSLALIVPATNAPPTLDRCLAALRDADAELIVVEEGASASPAAARNAGAARTSAEVLVFVDADVVVHDDAIERLRAAFASDPGLTAAFGSYDDSPVAPGVVSRFRNLLHHHVHTSAPGAAETFWAGLGAVRRDAFVEAGGFDADRFPLPAVEDIELGRRLRGRGARIVLDPEVRGTHLKRWSLAEMVRTDLLRRAIPWTRIQLEEGELSGSLNLSWRGRASAVLSVAFAAGALTRRPRIALVSLAGVAVTELPFLRLLARREGPAATAAGLGLLVLHKLVAIVGMAAGTVAHLVSPRR